MFSGVIESQTHEGGFLVSFTGSSPALESIIINADSGTYIGKVDGVLGNTNAPLAHVAHIDRKLDLEALIGIEVTIRPKKQREERRDYDRGARKSDRGRSENRRNERFERNDRRNDNRNGGDWECPKCNNSNFAFRTECNRCGEPRGQHSNGRSNDRSGGFQRNDRGGRFQRNDRSGGFQRNDRSGGNRNGGDWECPKCSNSNFAFRTECNRCGEPRGRHSHGRGNDRGGRFQRNERRGSFRDNRGRNEGGRREIFNDNDWECPKCKNSNFAFRTECNRCGEPRNGGNARGQRRDSNRRHSHSPRQSNERPPRREGERPPRRDGRDRRNERNYDNRNNNYGSRNNERPPPRKSREPRTFRKSRGNGPGHAHNRPPKPLIDPDRDNRE
ncbi:MAG: hypothetical protein CMA09_02455 [Euryarchaeota archaeon]|nr:hypothetical protein [Euryarchaeota archaeon]